MWESSRIIHIKSALSPLISQLLILRRTKISGKVGITGVRKEARCNGHRLQAMWAGGHKAGGGAPPGLHCFGNNVVNLSMMIGLSQKRRMGHTPA